MTAYFGFEGRVRPMTFWINTAIILVFNVIINALFVTVYVSWMTGDYQVHISNKPIYYLLSAVLLWRTASIAVRRFQDMDKEKEWVALLIPAFIFSIFPSLQYSGVGVVLAALAGICGFIAVGFMGFHPGDEGENTYGPAPVEGQFL